MLLSEYLFIHRITFFIVLFKNNNNFFTALQQYLNALTKNSNNLGSSETSTMINYTQRTCFKKYQGTRRVIPKHGFATTIVFCL